MITTPIQKPDKIRATAAAYKITQKYSIDNPREIILEDIAAAEGVYVVEGGLEGADARLVRSGDIGIIHIRKSIQGLGRKRFAIAHDLGHWELHQAVSQWMLCSDMDTSIYDASPIEVEANLFASELLMPSKLFRPRCEDAEPDLKLIKALSEEFATSVTAAALRFVEETNYACIVAFSENGSVKWWKRSDRCAGFWIERKHKIHKNSFAWSCLDQKVPAAAGMIPSWLWLPDSKEKPDEVYEQSMRLGNGTAVLSLIWIIEAD